MRKQIATLQRIEGEINQVKKEMQKQLHPGQFQFFKPLLDELGYKLIVMYEALEVLEKGGKR